MWIRSKIGKCSEVNKENIKYILMYVDSVSKMEDMLWLMSFVMGEYIDDWKSHPSLLVTSYLFDEQLGHNIIESTSINSMENSPLVAGFFLRESTSGTEFYSLTGGIRLFNGVPQH